METATQRKAYTSTATSAELINMLAAERCDPARLLELYYWSSDPGLLPIIRKFAALSREARSEIELLLASTEKARPAYATPKRAQRSR
jgi:hypothetical protein